MPPDPLFTMYSDYPDLLDKSMTTSDTFSAAYVDQILEARNLVVNELMRETGCETMGKLTGDKYTTKRNITKNMLAGWLEAAVDILNQFAVPVLSTAKIMSEELEQLKKERIEDRTKIIQLQEKLLEKKDEEIKEMKTTMQDTLHTEMKSYSSVLKSTCSRALAPRRVQAAVKSAAEEEDRGKTLVIYGLAEEKDEKLEEKVLSVLSMSHLDEKPRITCCDRIGKESSEGGPVTRPVKFSLTGTDHARQILKKTKRLRTIEGYTAVYISPDRTPDQRAANKKLVEEPKSRRAAEPNRRHYISRNTVFSGDT